MVSSSLPRPHARATRLPFGMTRVGVAFAAILLLAAALRLLNITAVGQANTYYTAAVESMLQSWRNFFFVAAEPGGSVSVDKPPIGLWVQAAFAAVLGVNGVAVVLPQILAGLASIAVLFHLVRRWAGDMAGLLAALVLAITPVSIAVERNNTPDATLILVLLLAAWAFINATETNRLRFVLLGAALVGVGFNIKMMQAFLPLPAFYALYLFGSQQTWRRKIVHLALATALLIPVSLSWAVIVDLTPADQRPYVGSSETNSALNLSLGYNGIQRLIGQVRGDSAARSTSANSTTPPASVDGQVPSAGGPDGRNGPGGAGGMFNTGAAGPLRMFQSGLAAQVSWLLPFGLILLAAMAARSWRRPVSMIHRTVMLWGGWLMICMVFFSVAQFFHQYYLAMLAPPLAAVIGIGAAFLWRIREQFPRRAAAVLVGGAIITLAFQVYAVQMYGMLTWWIALPVLLAALGPGALVFRRTTRIVQLGFTLLLVSLLVVPGIWSGYTTAYAGNNALPEAYAGTLARQGMGGMPPSSERPSDSTLPDGQPPAGMSGPGEQGSTNTALIDYLQANTQDVRYLLVVPSSGAGAGYVLATGRPVLYAGGFSGSDPVIEGEKLAALVQAGEVRYVLWGADGRRTSNSSITTYLQQSCVVVDDAPLTNTAGERGFGGASTLYRCDP